MFLIGAICLFVFSPTIVLIILSVLFVPIVFHYLIRVSQAKVKDRPRRGERGPIHDLALFFATAPMVWLALALDAAYFSYDTSLVLAGFLLLFQFPLTGLVLFFGRNTLFPAKGDTPRLVLFFLPWALMLVGLFFLIQHHGWGPTFTDPRVQISLFLIGFVWVICLGAFLRFGLKWGDSFENLLNPESFTFGPWLIKLCRWFTVGFWVAPIVWLILFGLLWWHWKVLTPVPEVTNGPPVYPWILQAHEFTLEFLLFVLAFGFPCGAALVWFTRTYLVTPRPEPQRWFLFLIPWGFLFLILLADPMGFVSEFLDFREGYFFHAIHNPGVRILLPLPR